MALRALMVRKSLDEKKKALEALREKDAEFDKREAELEASIEEASTDEERAVVEEEVGKFETEKEDHERAKADLNKEVEDLEEELRGIEEADQEAEKRAAEASAEIKKREDNKEMQTRNLFDTADKAAMIEREDVKAWISEIRSHISEKRDLTNIGLTIPQVMLGLLRENVARYSKLYRHVNVQRIGGTGRQVIMGSVPEAIWTECCGVLNELSLTFNDVEVDCFKIGGFFKVCNSVLEDSDIDLANVLLDAIGQAIGKALDKAILYGHNTAANNKMPLGIVSRLAQTSQPEDYPATARAWVDLHTTNIKSISADKTGVAFFQALIEAAGVIKSNYARGEKVWVMNETTYTALKVQAMSINAAGAVVSGIDGTMPVAGGIVEVLDFIPDNVIIGGYFELYLLAERAGQKFAQSEHAFFIQDQTAFKGTARYDGKPVIAEAFVAIGIKGVTPSATMTFAPDTANEVSSILLNQTSVEMDVDDTFQMQATTLPVKGDVTWTSSNTSKATISNAGLITATSVGSVLITAKSGNANATANVTISAGA